MRHVLVGEAVGDPARELDTAPRCREAASDDVVALEVVVRRPGVQAGIGVARTQLAAIALQQPEFVESGDQLRDPPVVEARRLRKLGLRPPSVGVL